jgi:hypothetical protein
LLLALPLLLAFRLQEPEPNRAAIVVRLNEDRVESRCVAFYEQSISGQDLLARSGLDVIQEASSAGVFVCSIAAEGCPANDCLCECKGEPCTYWSYWRLQNGEWRYAGLGAAATEVSAGAVEGWSWGPGSVSSAISPPVVTFEDVCSAEAVDVQPQAAPVPPGDLDWRPYALFAGLALLLGAGLLWLQRGRSA